MNLESGLRLQQRCRYRISEKRLYLYFQNCSQLSISTPFSIESAGLRTCRPEISLIRMQTLSTQLAYNLFLFAHKMRSPVSACSMKEFSLYLTNFQNLQPDRTSFMQSSNLRLYKAPSDLSINVCRFSLQPSYSQSLRILKLKILFRPLICKLILLRISSNYGLILTIWKFRTPFGGRPVS